MTTSEYFDMALVERIGIDLINIRKRELPMPKEVRINPLDYWTASKALGIKLEHPSDGSFKLSCPAGTVSINSSPEVSPGTVLYLNPISDKENA